MLGITRSNKGYTLVEVMVALVVFSFVAIIFAASVPLAIRSGAMNGQYAQAISLCQHKIDQMRAVGYGRINYTELSDAGIIDDSPNTPPYSFVGVDEVAKYLPNSTAVITTQNIAPNELKVIVTISWKSTTYTAKTSSMSLTALITNIE